MYFLKSTFLILTVLLTFACNKELIKSNESDSPVVIFDQASNFIKTHSSFLGIKNLDWDAIDAEYRAQVFEGMSDDSLYNVINAMLLELEDGHAYLYYKDKEVTTWDYTAGYPINFDKKLLEDYYWTSAQKIGPFTATILNEVGYFYYGSHTEQIKEEDMDQLIDFIQDTKGLIIDIRSNGGGDGTNTSTMLSRFIAEDIYLGKQLVKSGPGEDDYIESKYTLKASDSDKKYLNKEIVVLSNRGCASSGAFFVAYAKVLDKVISIGDKTGGAGGVGTSMQIGNGWQIVVSTTIGIDAKGNIIENGIEPTIKIDQTTADSLNHKDAILEAALLYLE